MTPKAKALGEQPAFPVPNEANVNGQEGLTKREWLFGQALNGFLAFLAPAEQRIDQDAVSKRVLQITESALETLAKD